MFFFFFFNFPIPTHKNCWRNKTQKSFQFSLVVFPRPCNTETLAAGGRECIGRIAVVRGAGMVEWMCSCALSAGSGWKLAWWSHGITANESAWLVLWF